MSNSATARNAALLAAFLGWMFDGFEMGLFPLTGRDALKELLGADGAADLNKWFGVIMAMFLVGAATGGVVFGWLGDRIGRVKAMSLSIFTYAIFTGLCGVASEAWHVAVYRFVASLGMGGEWSLGVALVNEVWPGKSRMLVAGLIGAAANVGYLLGGFLSLGLSSVLGSVNDMLIAIGLTQKTVTTLLSNNGWRILMMSGAVPAFLVFFIQLFVGESKKWEEEKARGATDHWATKDLLGVLIGCVSALSIVAVWSPFTAVPVPLAILVTIVGLVITLLGYLYPVWQYLGRAASQDPAHGRPFIIKRMLLGAGLAGVALMGTWGAVQWAPKWAEELAGDPALHAKDWAQIWTATGAIIFTMVAALMGDKFGRRITYTILCVATIIAALLFYQTNESYTNWFLFTGFLIGGISASFYGFFPLYFPELFPTQVRATGQGFCFNFGRVLAAIGALQTANLMSYFGGSFAKAGSVLCFIYLLGIVLVWFCPETKGKELS
ncbi:MAG: MFS transporter [Verrucomicrobiaceae bacterium]|nr:MFS transporter [Verrucomicrobiaceae bacterium]